MPHTKAIEILTSPNGLADSFQIKIKEIDTGAIQTEFTVNREELLNIIKFFKAVDNNFLQTLDCCPEGAYINASLSRGI